MELKPINIATLIEEITEINRIHCGIETTLRLFLMFQKELINRIHCGIETTKNAVYTAVLD